MWGANRTAGGRPEPVRSETRRGLYPSRRELVARVFLQLEQSGVIIRNRGRVVIRYPPRLARHAFGEPEASIPAPVT
jgi:hypothetical protein